MYKAVVFDFDGTIYLNEQRIKYKHSYHFHTYIVNDWRSPYVD